jgi:hypothetical protein
MVMPRPKRLESSWVIAAVCGVPVILYFVFFFSCAVNIPFGDDYPALGFVVNFTNPSWPDKLSLLFSLHNEHRIVTLRLVLLILHSLSIKINLVAVAFLANLSLVGIALLLAKSLDSKKTTGDPSIARRNLFLQSTPIFLLLFQPHHYQMTLWAMCAFTNLVAYFLAFLSLYLLVRSRGSRTFAAAVLCAALGAYTNGNGVFAFFIGGLVLLLQKRYRWLWKWAAAGFFIVGFYFLGYRQNPEHPNLIPYLKHHVWPTVEYLFSATGAFGDFGALRPYVSITVGGLILAGLVVLFQKRIYRRNVFLSSAIAFVFLSLAALTATRAPFGVGQSFEPRYRFASVLLLVLLYLGLLETARNKKVVLHLFLAFSTLFSAASFCLDFRNGRAHRDVLIVNLFEWNAGKAALPYSNPEHAENILRLAVKRGIYETPKQWPIDRPKYPFGAVDRREDAAAGKSTEVVFSGWALDDSGRLRIIVRRGRLPSDRRSINDRRGLEYVGQARLKEGRVPLIALIYYGFPGTDRMLWEFRLGPPELVAGQEEKLYFFARDRVGHEALIGESDLAADAVMPNQKPDGAT